MMWTVSKINKFKLPKSFQKW